MGTPVLEGLGLDHDCAELTQDLVCALLSGLGSTGCWAGASVAYSLCVYVVLGVGCVCSAVECNILQRLGES